MSQGPRPSKAVTAGPQTHAAQPPHVKSKNNGGTPSSCAKNNEKRKRGSQSFRWRLLDSNMHAVQPQGENKATLNILSPRNHRGHNQLALGACVHELGICSAHRQRKPLLFKLDIIQMNMTFWAAMQLRAQWRKTYCMPSLDTVAINKRRRSPRIMINRVHFLQSPVLSCGSKTTHQA